MKRPEIAHVLPGRRRPDPASAAEHRQRIVQLMHADKYKAASRECERYLSNEDAHDDHRAEVQQWYGYCLHQAGAHARAIDELAKALAMKVGGRTTHLAHSNTAQALWALRRHDEARQHFERSLAFAEDRGDVKIVQTFIASLDKESKR